MLSAVATVGCGGGDSDVREEPGTPAGEAERRGQPRLRPPACPAGLVNCARASGRIAYVERVDPDGDGDAHFVLVGSRSITGPGITVVDVRADLRPRPLPGPGDLLAAAGPVYRGTFGQRQIEAVAVRVAREGHDARAG